MQIRIFQINEDRDTHHAAFSDLEHTLANQKSEEIDAGIYDASFSGDVDCGSLEDVFQMFNLDPPAGYTGRSMSVSDVIQVVDSTEVPSGFYFCDAVGFKEICFDPGLVPEPEPEDTIRVVLLEPGKEAQITKIGSSLEEMQSVVSGYIEAVYPFEEEAAIVCNEEGKLLGLPLNRALRNEDTREIYDIIAGPCFICGCSSNNFGSLGAEQAEKYMQMFRRPELFFKVSGHLISIPYDPEPESPAQADRSR